MRLSNISFGALAKPIKEQLTHHGLFLDGHNLYQEQADAILLLEMTNLITETQAYYARKKLVKIIISEMEDERANAVL